MRFKSTVLLVLVALLGIAGFSQQSAKMKPVDGSSQVSAGEVITFEVTLDKAPNFNGGSIGLAVGPKDPVSEISEIRYNSAVPKDQATFTVGILIPANSPSERWQIKSLGFVGPGSGEKLLLFTPFEFDVVEARKLVIPEKARIQVRRVDER